MELDVRIHRADYQLPLEVLDANHKLDVTSIALFAHNVVYEEGIAGKAEARIRLRNPHSTVILRTTGQVSIMGSGTEDRTLLAVRRVLRLIHNVLGKEEAEIDPTRLVVNAAMASLDLARRKFPVDAYVGTERYPPYPLTFRRDTAKSKRQYLEYLEQFPVVDSRSDFVTVTDETVSVRVQPRGQLQGVEDDNGRTMLMVRLVMLDMQKNVDCLYRVTVSVYTSGQTTWAGGSVGALREAHKYLLPILLDSVPRR